MATIMTLQTAPACVISSTLLTSQKATLPLSSTSKKGVSIFNLGTGKATSVMEMIHAFEKASGKSLPYRITDRRPGDLAKVYADPTKAERELNWKATHTIEDAMRDTLKFLAHVAEESHKITSQTIPELQTAPVAKVFH